MRFNMPLRSLTAAAFIAALLPGAANAQVTRIKSNPNAVILDAAKVSAGAEMIFVSGQLPSPVDPNKPMAEVKSLEEMGDTKTQTLSALGKIKKILESQGYKMSDTIKLSLFIAQDPRIGKMDFAGAQEGFKAFFNTPETPVTVARSTFQVAGLVGPHYLIEIEAIAAKQPA